MYWMYSAFGFNFDADASIPGECSYPDTGYDCETVYSILTVTEFGYVRNLGCTLENALNFDPEATENDGSCIIETPGCMDNIACNYDPQANVSDNSCDYTSCVGCMVSTACNFDPTATIPGECIYPETGYYCDGTCTSDFDNDDTL